MGISPNRLCAGATTAGAAARAAVVWAADDCPANGVAGELRSSVGTYTGLGADSPEVGETRGDMVPARYPYDGECVTTEDLALGGRAADALELAATVAAPIAATVGVIPIIRRGAVAVLDRRSAWDASPCSAAAAFATASSLSCFNLLLWAPRLKVSAALYSSVSSFFGLLARARPAAVPATGTSSDAVMASSDTAEAAETAAPAMARVGGFGRGSRNVDFASLQRTRGGHICASSRVRVHARRIRCPNLGEECVAADRKTDRGPFALPCWDLILARADRDGRARTRGVGPLESALPHLFVFPRHCASRPSIHDLGVFKVW